MGVGARVPGMRGSKPGPPPQGITPNSAWGRVDGVMANTGNGQLERFAKRIAEELEEHAEREAKRNGEGLQEKPRDETDARTPEERVAEAKAGEA